MNIVESKSIIRRGLLAAVVIGALAFGPLAGAVILDRTTGDTINVATDWD